MKHDEALEAVKSRVANDRLIKHMLAVEAIMQAVAARLGENEETWALAGLVHDIDYDETAKDPARHGLVGGGYLREMKVDEAVVHAVESHAGHRSRDSRMDKALYAVDPLSGLLVAAALMHPSKKIGALDAEFVLNRFKEKRFAAGANREQIKSCEELGLSLADFVGIGLRAMQQISGELGL
ncbi:MAG TPA: HDIG domain-containing protein [bacterium]|nr:HDIG domain-containing protein [bacterium]